LYLSRSPCSPARSNLGANPLVIQLPIGSEENFKGMVDLVKMKVWHSCPAAARQLPPHPCPRAPHATSCGRAPGLCLPCCLPCHEAAGLAAFAPHPPPPLLLPEQALVWGGEELGAKFEEVDIPEDMKVGEPRLLLQSAAQGWRLRVGSGAFERR